MVMCITFRVEVVLGHKLVGLLMPTSNGTQLRLNVRLSDGTIYWADPQAVELLRARALLAGDRRLAPLVCRQVEASGCHVGATVRFSVHHHARGL